MLSSESTEELSTAVPDLVVGIDFGMTGTAVAFAAPVDQNVTVLRDWPGSPVAQDKVPSVIAYQEDELSSWGFDVNIQEMPKAPGIRSCFKGVFDEQDLRQVNQDAALNITTEEVEQWLADYLRQKTIQRFRKIIEQVGFGQSDESSSVPHEAEATLNEAEAAIAYYFAESKLPNAGDHLMIADIGGGTSDVSIFLVKGYEETSPKLFLKAAGQGRNTGSTKIDEGFEAVLRERLTSIPRPNLEGADDATLAAATELQAWKMVQDTAFLAEKCRYGAKPSGTLSKPYFYVPVPQLNADFSSSALEVESGRMKFDKDELFKPLFEDQCSRIWEQFESQIEESFPHSGSSLDKMKLRVVLAGGMGRSEYVRSFLESRFRSKYATVPQFTVAAEPQLAVCKGLVHDALKQINQGGLFRYSTQAWYGIAKNNTFQSVEWFLKKDEEVALPASRDIKRLLDVDSEGKIALQLVKTMEDIQVGWLSKKSKKLVRDPTVVESLTDKLPHEELQPYKGLGLQKSKCQVTVKSLLGRGAIRFQIAQGGKPVGDPLYVSEFWHSTPVFCEPKDRGSPRAPRGSQLGKGKGNINWGTIGTWLFGGAALAASLGLGVLQFVTDAENEEDEEE
ncbi:hypothetical protein ACJZ2D_005228 [Fusarium nematophilum]